MPPSSAPGPTVVAVHAYLADVVIVPDIEVVYAEQAASLTASAFIAGGKSGPTGPLAIATATIDFGDGSQGDFSGACTAPPAPISVQHVYHAVGDRTVSVVSATLCEAGWQLTPDSGEGIQVLPAPAPGTETWPACTTFQLRFTDGGTRAGLGNVATVIHLENISSSGCGLEGYPDLQLVSATGSVLPTHVRQATGGAYMFASMTAGRVTLAPNGTASFEIAYGDNPFGDAANEPYDVACPPSKWVRVILPDSHQFGTARIRIGPCGGEVGVSPIYPGSEVIEFP